MSGRCSNDGDHCLRAALVGQGISRSMTPAMHVAEGRAQGLRYSYDFIDTGMQPYCTHSLSRIVDHAQADGLVGLSITHPYKIEILQHLDDLSANARKLGAVNTVVFRDGKRTGHNTDYSGFVASYRLALNDAVKDRVLLLGAGGAGAAVGFALLDCGIRELLVYDADSNQAHKLVEKLQAHHLPVDIHCPQTLEQPVLRGLSGVVNATPMGMANYPGSALPLDLLTPAFWVTDIVYFPHETELLARARALGCRVMAGSGMAVWQAVHAFELFTGYSASPERMAATLNRLICYNE